MPFKSKVQMRRFAVMEQRGELPKGTFERWKGETKNWSRLPERIGKKRQIKSRQIRKRRG